MLVLGIDTATSTGSVGVLEVVASGRAAEVGDAAAPQTLLRAELSRPSGMAHGAELLPMVAECLAEARVEVAQLDGVAVSIGPGSFTGLRVGLATAKGLVFGSSASLVGVPTLEALAEAVVRRGAAAGAWPVASPDPPLICACLDARKGEVYAALFAAVAAPANQLDAAVQRLDEDRAEPVEALLGQIEHELAARRSTATAEVLFVGDGAERYRVAVEQRLGARAAILSSADVHPRGGVVAQLGAARLLAGRADDIAALAPRYARLSEAEKVRASRSGQAAR